MFTSYLALGDSMSIDLYPALDQGETDVAVALERTPGAGRVAPLGAASLLHRNDDAHWPEETGADLESRYPGIAFANLAADGATIGDVFGEQLPAIEPSDEPTLVTLTVGGDDLFSAFSIPHGSSLKARIAHDIAEAYDLLVDRVQEIRPNALLLATTIYDPSDRTARIPGVLGGAGKLPLPMLDTVNAHIRQLAAARENVMLADVYAHFLGHGVTAPDEDRWYWRRSPLEPNGRGASEIRRVWLEALERAEIERAER